MSDTTQNRPATLDTIDLQILDELQRDGGISNADLARHVGLSPSACLIRTKNLKDRGVIRRQTVLIDESSVGLSVQAFTFINLSPHTAKTAEEFARKARSTRQIVECYNITGNWDYLLKIVAADINAYRDFIISTLVEFPGVDRIETIMVLKAEKQSGLLPLIQSAIKGGSHESVKP